MKSKSQSALNQLFATSQSETIGNILPCQISTEISLSLQTVSGTSVNILVRVYGVREPYN